jgi:hypothetical protein
VVGPPHPLDCIVVVLHTPLVQPSGTPKALSVQQLPLGLGGQQQRAGARFAGAVRDETAGDRRVGGRAGAQWREGVGVLRARRQIGRLAAADAVLVIAPVGNRSFEHTPLQWSLGQLLDPSMGTGSCTGTWRHTWAAVAAAAGSSITSRCASWNRLCRR